MFCRVEGSVDTMQTLIVYEAQRVWQQRGAWTSCRLFPITTAAVW